MTGLGQNLQDYLSRNQKDTKVSVPGDSTSSGFSLGKLNFFNRSDKNSQSESNDVANGWFSQAQQDPYLPSLSKKQRILGFVLCLLMGTFCFSMILYIMYNDLWSVDASWRADHADRKATLYLPLLILKARKFAVLYTLGSLFIISSFSLLWGPMNHVKHLFSVQRLPFTTAYFGSMLATLYFSLWLRSTVFTVIFAVLQILALVWYIVSYIPGGQTGLKFFSKIFYAAASKTVNKTLPV